MSCHMPNIGETFKHVIIRLFYMANHHLPSKHGSILLSLRKDNPVLKLGQRVTKIDTRVYLYGQNMISTHQFYYRYG